MLCLIRGVRSERMVGGVLLGVKVGGVMRTSSVDCCFLLGELLMRTLLRGLRLFVTKGVVDF